MAKRDWTSRLRGRDTQEPPSYAAIVLFYAGKDVPQLMCSKNRVVVFDTEEHARHFAPLLRDGCTALWNSAEDYLWWVLPDGTLPTEGLRGAAIATDYDVYDLPPNHPVRSETRLRSWKRHVHYGVWLKELEAERQAEKEDALKSVRESVRAALLRPAAVRR